MSDASSQSPEAMNHANEIRANAGQGNATNALTHVVADVRPRIEIARTSSGAYSWRISVFADDASVEAVDAACALAEDTEQRLRDKYGRGGI